MYFSEDYRYVFYPDKISEYGYSYYWKDLKSDKEEAQKIDGGAFFLYVTINKSGSKFFYIKGEESKLYVYDRIAGEKNKLDENVIALYVSDDGNYIVYVTYKDDKKTLYEMSLKGIEGEKKKIDSDCSIVEAYPNSKKVYYLKDNSLYLKENNKDKVKISSDVTWVVSVVDESSLYYLKSDKVYSGLDSFIEDDYAESDNQISEPALPVYPEEPQYPNQNDYIYYVWYSSYWGGEYNEELDEWGYWDEELDWMLYSEAIELYNVELEKWKQDCKSLDEEYERLYSIYEDKLYRDVMRQELKDEIYDMSYSKYSLYYWSNGNETAVAEDVAYDNPYIGFLAVSKDNPVVVYQKYEGEVANKLKFSELLEDNGYSAILIYSDVLSSLNNSRNKLKDVFIAKEGKEFSLKTEDAVNWNILDDGSIYFLDEFDIETNSGTLKSVRLSGKNIEVATVLAKDVADYRVFNGKRVVYCKDMKDGSGEIYQNGKKLASDVYFDSLYSLEDNDTLYYLIDYSPNDEEGSLCCLKGGEQTRISDDVHRFIPVNDSKVIYLTDFNSKKIKGDLVLYQSKKKRETIDTDVSALFDLRQITHSPLDMSHLY